MATKNEYFDPKTEFLRAIGQNGVEFLKHPMMQSQQAQQILQQLFLDWAAKNRPMSPLDPNNRPGVPVDALPASRGMLTGAGS